MLAGMRWPVPCTPGLCGRHWLARSFQHSVFHELVHTSGRQARDLDGDGTRVLTQARCPEWTAHAAGKVHGRALACHRRRGRGPDARSCGRAHERRSAGMSEPTSGGRKDLVCTARATAFQRAYVGELKRRVVERGEPFVIAQADTPHEIFHVMDIALITNQWWSAYLSAKQLSAPYFAALERQGYPSHTCRYCTLGLACTLAGDAATAPWGGLPRPTALVARLTCDCIQHVFTQWAQAL